MIDPTTYLAVGFLAGLVVGFGLGLWGNGWDGR